MNVVMRQMLPFTENDTFSGIRRVDICLPKVSIACDTGLRLGLRVKMNQNVKQKVK